MLGETKAGKESKKNNEMTTYSRHTHFSEAGTFLSSIISSTFTSDAFGALFR